MQSKLYRFEIVRSLVNGVFEARDPASNAMVYLHEWTPLPDDRPAAKHRLEALADQLGCEVLTADASLYVASASRALGREVITILRAQGLFTGTWADETPAPAPPPPPPPFPSAVPPVEAARTEPALQAAVPMVEAPVTAIKAPKRRLPWAGILLSMLATAGVSYALGHSAGASSGYENGESTATQRSAGTLDALNARNSELQSQLTNVDRSAHGSAEALRTFAGTNLLRVKNGCDSPLRAAVLFEDYDRQRVVKGWVTIEPGMTSIVAASPSPDFYIYADTPAAANSWSGRNTPTIGVTDAPFLYREGDAAAADARQVTTLLAHMNSAGDSTTLTCGR